MSMSHLPPAKTLEDFRLTITAAYRSAIKEGKTKKINAASPSLPVHMVSVTMSEGAWNLIDFLLHELKEMKQTEENQAP